ncbi:MAG TPA: glycosyltransferase family 2 protein [Thermoanaerobaculia bacterium]|nr:glycosyltransferase family 2 protein [Thermoanaerobaculia bacterium]
MTRLSVVIPTYDTAAMTLRCCRAVLASMPDCEVIVADDASRDGTAELLAREVPQVRVVRLDENRGFATAANRGLAESTADIMLLLNSDAIVEPDALRALLQAFDADAQLGIAGARLLNADGSPQWSGGRTPTLPWLIGVVSGLGPLFKRRKRASASPNMDWVSGAAMAFRRAVWRDTGPLSERFLFYCQDLDFCLRARENGWRIALIEAAHVRHDLGATVAHNSPLHHDPERLWPDLLTWCSSHYGKAWTKRARPILLLTAALRAVVDHRDPRLQRAWRRLL